jgi:serine/threonine protein kinase
VPARELEPGITLGRYVIATLLGQGAMGTVYRAHDVELRRDVALKVVRQPGDQAPSDAQRARQRIFREARAAAALEHPNVVRVYDAGEIDEIAFVAMELVVGRSLRSFVGHPEVSVAQRCSWLTDVAKALVAAHARGIVHRDVKPDNVMVGSDGIVKVLDFGIARAMPHAQLQEPATVTEQGFFIGTPAYMSPEQLRGEAIDERADQFAWGVMAFELLSGTTPWTGEGSMLALVSRMLSVPAPALSGLLPEVSLEVESVIGRALSRDASHRFPSMAALLEAFAPASASSAAPPLAAPVGPTATTVDSSAPSIESGTRMRDITILTNMAFGTIGDLVVAFMNEKAPTDAEHIASLPIFRRAVSGEIRKNLTVTMGGVPSAYQRKSYNETLAGYELPTAVVSDRGIVRRTTAVLSWFNSKIRSFSRAEMEQALVFLGVPRADWAEVLARIELFESQLVRAGRRQRPR